MRPLLAPYRLIPAALGLLLVAGCASAPSSSPTTEPGENPFAEFVWPQPPDEPRIGLVDILGGRLDIEGDTKMRKFLMSATPESPFDKLMKPHDVAFEDEDHLLVSDSFHGAILRFDYAEKKMDVLGTSGSIRLERPLGISVGPDGTIYAADIGQAKVIAYASDGDLVAVFGSDEGELENPTDAKVSPDGKLLYVADTKLHQIVVFDLATHEVVETFGGRGEGPGEFNAPTSLAFNLDGDLLVVDQLNARIQLLGPDGEYIDEFGGRGVNFGAFVRPKDIAVDEYGLIYVTDAAFNNVQIFDTDFQLLTFVGSGGRVGPGLFNLMIGVSVYGEKMALVDQTGRRVQVFRYLFDRASGE